MIEQKGLPCEKGLSVFQTADRPRDMIDVSSTIHCRKVDSRNPILKVKVWLLNYKSREGVV